MLFRSKYVVKAVETAFFFLNFLYPSKIQTFLFLKRFLEISDPCAQVHMLARSVFTCCLDIARAEKLLEIVWLV